MRHDLTHEQARRLVPLVARFLREIEQRERLDTEIASVLENPRSRARQVISRLVCEELRRVSC